MAADALSLTRKLAEVMAEVGNVPKRGRNNFHGYEFVMESDLVDAVRPALAKRNVMVFPDVLEESVRVVPGSKGDNYVTRIKVAFTFVDGDSGEERTFHIFADGQDNQDKGPYKALTGAVKYGLMKAFLIGTGDDPEHDRGHADPTPKKSPAPGAPSPKQLEFIEDLKKKLTAATGAPVDPPAPRTSKAAAAMIDHMKAEITRLGKEDDRHDVGALDDTH